MKSQLLYNSETVLYTTLWNLFSILLSNKFYFEVIKIVTLYAFLFLHCTKGNLKRNTRIVSLTKQQLLLTIDAVIVVFTRREVTHFNIIRWPGQ
jgi:hypothetical protein